MSKNFEIEINWEESEGKEIEPALVKIFEMLLQNNSRDGPDEKTDP